MSATRLVIVESPSKAKKIAGFLGPGWRVIASRGHVRDLPPKALGVDIEHGFKPTYEPVRGKGSVVKTLRAEAKAADEIYLATDPDREGEAIAWHIREIIGGQVRGKPVYRVTFQEITKKAVQAAFARPRQLDMGLVDSQQARRVLDRLVGWEVSPVLRRTFGTSGLSAGRVQSVALRLVVERERAIESFVPEEYWTLDALLATRERPPGQFLARLHRLSAASDKELDPRRLPGERARAIAAELEVPGTEWRVLTIKQSERRRSPPPPFITSTMQQAASSRLGMNPKRTMKVAQDLYEGGHITYHRTDSPAVSQEAQEAARAVIAQLFGAEALPAKPPFYKAKGGNAQEAHECIRPTDPAKRPETASLAGDEARLYKLIWARFLASQMGPALYDVTTAEIEVRRAGSILPYGFRAVGSVLRVAGWLAVYGVKPGATDDEAEQENQQALPPLVAGQPLDLRELRPEQHFTQPPPRFSEAGLIKALEQHGVGRPSTYATIMDTIQARGYVERRGKNLVPTEAGRLVTAFLVERFPDLLNVEFTAQMETSLDRIAEGQVRWTELMGEFYTPFHEKVESAKGQQGPSLAEPCPECGEPLVTRYGKFGRYTACSACDYKPDGAKPVGRDCPQCGKPLVGRRSRFGKFIGCSGYPECQYIEKPEPKKRAEKGEALLADLPGAGQPCPQCGRPLAAKSGRYGPFVGCSGYPACRYILKTPPPSQEAGGESGEDSPAGGKRGGRRPAGARSKGGLEQPEATRGAPPVDASLDGVGEPCPECGQPLVAKRGRYGPFVGCSGYPACRYILKKGAPVSKREAPGQKKPEL